MSDIEEDVDIDNTFKLMLRKEFIDNIGLRVYINTHLNLEETLAKRIVEDTDKSEVFVYHFAYYIIKSIDFLIKGYPPPRTMTRHFEANFISILKLLNISDKYCSLLIIKLNDLIHGWGDNIFINVGDIIMYERIIATLEEKLNKFFLIKLKRYDSRSEILHIFEKIRLKK